MSFFFIRSRATDINIKIINSSSLKDEVLLRRIKTVPSLDVVQKCKNISYVVEISDEKVSINGDYHFEFKGKLSPSDSYVFIHALFYKIFFDSGYICIHAGAVFDKNNETILFVGDFDAGKSHLNYFFSKNGYEICSADHCLINVENGQPVFVAGSCFDTVKDDVSQFDYLRCNEKRLIKKILFLQGVQDDGKLDFREINEIKTIAKKLSTHMFWPYFSGVMSMEEKCFVRMFPKDMQKCEEFWKSVKKIYLCRGDKAKIFEVVNNARK